MLKIITILLMILDHVTIFIFPEYLHIVRYFTAVGFPLFAFMGVQGLKFTHDRLQYFINIFFCCACAQPIFSLLFSPSHRLNDLFSILFGLLIIHLYEDSSSYKVFYFVPLLLVLNVVSIYILLIFILYFFIEDKLLLYSSTICFFLLSFYLSGEFSVLTGPLFLLIIARPLLRINISKYFFYAFYPAHLFLIFLFIK